MKWGSPQTYAWLHRVSLTDQYKAQLLSWLQTENPELHKLVLKEIGIGDRKRRADPAPEVGQGETTERGENCGQADESW